MNHDLIRHLKGWIEFCHEMKIDLIDRQTQLSRIGPPEGPSDGVIAKKETSTSSTSMKNKSISPDDSPLTEASPPLYLGGSSSLGLFDESSGAPEIDSLQQIREDIGDCERCKLSKHRKNIVFGSGNSKSKIVFVGEAPGADEDEQGLPFVGRAGKLLNQLIHEVGMKRSEVYICNIVKCRPPGNRTPEKDEIKSCKPFIIRQIGAVHPKLICCLGSPALRTMLPEIKEGITKIRGQLLDFHGIKLLPTFHPAYILRNPREGKAIRKDFKLIVEFLGETMQRDSS